jgi:hypothetical protein
MSNKCFLQQKIYAILLDIIFTLKRKEKMKLKMKKKFLKIFITKYRAYPKLLKMIGEQMFISFAMI